MAKRSGYERGGACLKAGIAAYQASQELAARRYHDVALMEGVTTDHADRQPYGCN
jgi:hypothetical protein